MRLLLVLMLATLASCYPGLLRVPKVYNAVITSNQNLSPSRAYPVIQPVIHRTAIGYVPPIYYTQVAPQFSRPEVVHLPQNPKDAKEESESQTESESKKDERVEGPKESKKPKKDEPLSFYPNYHSLYYDPYFYAYNGYNPHLAAGTYYVDYQPYGSLDPIPASAPKDAFSGHLLPGYHEPQEKKKEPREKEKIPDVPPPPLPTSGPKSS